MVRLEQVQLRHIGKYKELTLKFDNNRYQGISFNTGDSIESIVTRLTELISNISNDETFDPDGLICQECFLKNSTMYGDDNTELCFDCYEKQHDESNDSKLLKTLLTILDKYTSLVNCGDCGNWDCETEDEIIDARKVIAEATGERHGL